jgi:hypothetical protein
VTKNQRPEVSLSSNDVFDYETLSPETHQKIKEKTSELKSLIRRSAQNIIDIGQTLIEVKQRLGHGQYGKWLKAELGWSDFTARQFINAAKTFKSEIFSDLNFDPSALYILSTPSTPVSAQQEALERANNGENISQKVAKEIVTRHKVSSTLKGEALSVLPELSVNDSHPEITLESLNPEISSHENDEPTDCVDVEAITMPDDLEKDMDPEIQKSFSVGDRIRLNRREQGPDKWTGKIAKIWEITDGGWLRVNVEGHKGVKFTLHPDWVELLEEPEMLEPISTPTMPDSENQKPEQAIQVSIPLTIEGKIVQVEGIVSEVEVHYVHRGIAGTTKVPANRVVFPKSL